MHNAPPPGWPQMSPSLFYRDAAAAIDWLCEAFEFEVQLKVEGEPGEIVHSQLVYGQALVMVSSDAAHAGQPEPGRDFKLTHTSPLDLGGRLHQALCMFVDDVEAHCRRAKSRGARIFSEPATQDYGDDYWSDRSYGAYDCEGHQWWFMQRLRNPAP
jgi:uncharacterized glyoxalase superfamily protein PhnB